MLDFSKTKEEIINRYDNRFKEHGIDPLSLNWQDFKSQNKRFENILDFININNKKIIDIGCGFADLLKYIQEKKINFKEYAGTDINPNFINQCKKLYPERNFFTNNLFNEDLPKDNYDIALMVGMLSYKFKSFDNNHFIKEVINKAFSSVKETLIFDMQSSIINPDYPTADHIHYQNPGEILNFALSLTPYVTIKHDYMPNPAREFLIILNHNPR
tara:strand:+ start:284 stop:928 length:645 start_codon:yes stop_codon:yes gene_type:complete